MSLKNPPPLIRIILRYDAPLQRLARRILIQHKHRAADVVKWAMESIYEENRLYEGPHLRRLLIEKTKEMALGYNKALRVYRQIITDGGHPLNPGLLS